jgi:hypothetical protein
MTARRMRGRRTARMVLNGFRADAAIDRTFGDTRQEHGFEIT